MNKYELKKNNTEKRVKKLLKIYLWWNCYDLSCQVRRYTRYGYRTVRFIDQKEFWKLQDLNRSIALNHAKYTKGELNLKKSYWEKAEKEFRLKKSDPRRIWKEDLDDLKYE